MNSNARPSRGLGKNRKERLAHQKGRRGNARASSSARKKHSIIWVFTEGAVTEPAYFRLFKARLRNSGIQMEIKSLGGGNPLEMVQASYEMSKHDFESGDQVWCVFDVECPEKQPKLDEAIRFAEKKKISLGISNPCFEVWLILHHKEHAAHLTSKQAKAQYQLVKTPGFDYIATALEAKRRAGKLTDGTNSQVCDVNPSTNVDRILDHLFWS